MTTQEWIPLLPLKTTRIYSQKRNLNEKYDDNDLEDRHEIVRNFFILGTTVTSIMALFMISSGASVLTVLLTGTIVMILVMGTIIYIKFL
jgi:hypothetical protein